MGKGFLLLMGTCTLLYLGCKSGTNNIRYVTNNGTIVRETLDSNQNIIATQQVLKTGGNYQAFGIHKEFYPNGKLKYLGNKSGDSRIGNYYTFYESGSIQSINVKTEIDSYYHTTFNSFGVRNAPKPLLYVTSLDTFYVKKGLLVVTGIDLFGGIRTSISIKISDDQGQIIYDTTSVKENHVPFVVQILPYHLKIDKPGKYTCVSTATYRDSVSNILLKVDTSKIQLYGKE